MAKKDSKSSSSGLRQPLLPSSSSSSSAVPNDADHLPPPAQNPDYHSPPPYYHGQVQGRVYDDTHIQSQQHSHHPSTVPPSSYQQQQPALASSNEAQRQQQQQLSSDPPSSEVRPINASNVHPASASSSAVQYVPVPVRLLPYVPPNYRPCVDGLAHHIRTDLTLSGILCGILLFPIGLACMLTWLQRRCTKCGMRFE